MTAWKLPPFETASNETMEHAFGRILTVAIALAERLGHEAILRPLLVAKRDHARMLHGRPIGSHDYPESAA